MQPFPPTVILRHKKENLKKCSLRGLESREDFIFYSYPPLSLPPLEGYVYLTLDAPLLSKKEANLGLFLIDSTWRYANQMQHKLAPWLKSMVPRQLPPEFRTAYPRKQTECSDPECGLASIEALFIAYRLLGRDTAGLLDLYHWKEAFLTINQKSL